MKKYLSGYLLKSIIIFTGLSLASLTYAQDNKAEGYQTAQHELKEVQKQLMEKLANADKENLRKSQKYWNRFKTLDCMNAKVGDEALNCLESRTLERIQHLRERLSKLENQST
ncbi:MAG: DUF1311 domain-containing protein [Betaproteobacteria bacterium]|nr:DUF1311 domain-containing protein [Betaproteobacteria bacterium]